MENPENSVKKVHRPLFLSLVCVSGFVYFGFLSLLFLLVLIFNSWSANILSDYFPEYTITPVNVILFGGMALLLNVIALTGIVMIWKLKLSGFFTLLFALLIISILPFLTGYGSWASFTIHLLYILLFILFLRRLN